MKTFSAFISLLGSGVILGFAGYAVYTHAWIWLAALFIVAFFSSFSAILKEKADYESK